MVQNPQSGVEDSNGNRGGFYLTTGDELGFHDPTYNKEPTLADIATGAFDTVVESGDDLAAILNATATNDRVFIASGTYELTSHQAAPAAGVEIVAQRDAIIRPNASTGLAEEMVLLDSVGTVVSGGTWDANGQGYEAIEIRADECVVKNARFVNHTTGNYPCNVWKADHCTIRDSLFDGNGEYGPTITGTITESSGVWANHNKIVNNTVFLNEGAGIKIRGSRHGLVSGNTVLSASPSSGGCRGISFAHLDEPNRYNEVTGNTIRAPSAGATIVGVFYRADTGAADSSNASEGNHLAGNNIWTDDYAAVWINGDGLFCANNDVYGSGSNGILVDSGASDNVVVNNRLTAGSITDNSGNATNTTSPNY